MRAVEVPSYLPAPGERGEFVRKELHHVREGKHGARSSKQAIAIGLSKARRAGVKLKRGRRRRKPSATRWRGGTFRPNSNRDRNPQLGASS